MKKINEDAKLDEKKLVQFLAEELEKRDYIVYNNINPASYKYKDYWKQWFGDEVPPLQPQIDIVVIDKQDFQIRAIEVKLFKRKGKRISKSYYNGIDECLALMNFGFRSIALWHCFKAEIPFKDANNYAIHLMNLRQNLNLWFDYTCFRIGEEEDRTLIQHLLKPGWDYWYKGLPSKIEWKHDNPLRYQPEAQKILDFIRHILRIPTKK